MTGKHASLLIVLVLVTGCVTRPNLSRPEGELHDRQTTQITKIVQGIAINGDWIVTRGYKSTDNLIANLSGVPLSHVGVYDKSKEQIIESEAAGVHVTPLRKFIDKSHRVLVIRPRWLSPGRGEIAVENAYALEGKHYDLLGTVGLDSPRRYYCTELAIEIYGEWQDPKEKFPPIITPGVLFLYGTILFDSLPRDEMDIKQSRRD